MFLFVAPIFVNQSLCILLIFMIHSNRALRNFALCLCYCRSFAHFFPFGKRACDSTCIQKSKQNRVITSNSTTTTFLFELLGEVFVAFLFDRIISFCSIKLFLTESLIERTLPAARRLFFVLFSWPNCNSCGI